MAARCYQHVRWFEIAVHHQLRMCAGRPPFRFPGSARCVPDRRCLLGRMVEQRFCHRHIQVPERLPEQSPGVDEPCDAGMIQPCQQRPLCANRASKRSASPSVRRNDGSLGLIGAIGAGGKPYLAHAADADDLLQSPRPHSSPGCGGVLLQARSALARCSRPSKPRSPPSPITAPSTVESSVVRPGGRGGLSRTKSVASVCAWARPSSRRTSLATRGSRSDNPA